MTIRPHDSTVGDMQREILELRALVARAAQINPYGSIENAAVRDEARATVAAARRPPYCHGQCVNAPEGEPPNQRTFNMVCAGCVREMDRRTEEAIDAKAREDYEKLTPRQRTLVDQRAKSDPTTNALMVEPEHAIVGREVRAWCVMLCAQGEEILAGRVARVFDEIQKHAPWNGRSRCDGTDMEIGAALDYQTAYLKGQEDGTFGTLRALTGILDGPLDAKPSFGARELNAVAERLLAMRAELDAVHGDLGEKVQENLLTQEDVNETLRLLNAPQGMDLVTAAKRAADETTMLRLRVQALEGGIPTSMAVAQSERAEAIDQAARDARRADANAADCAKLVEAVGKVAMAVGIAWSDADVPTALEVLAEVPTRFEILLGRVRRLEMEAVNSLTAAGIALPAEEPTEQGEIPMAVAKLARQRDKAARDAYDAAKRHEMAMARADRAEQKERVARNAIGAAMGYSEGATLEVLLLAIQHLMRAADSADS
jgi:hypothetical protein